MTKKQLEAYVRKLNVKIDLLIVAGKDYSALAKLHMAAVKALRA